MTDSALSPGPARMVTGLFTNRESAERGYQSATRLGYENSDIDVLMSEETRNRYFAPGHDTKGAERQFDKKCGRRRKIGRRFGWAHRWNDRHDCPGACWSGRALVRSRIGHFCCWTHCRSPDRCRGCRPGRRIDRGACEMGHSRTAHRGIRTGYSRGRHSDGSEAALR
jgi:hypothetical protein